MTAPECAQPHVPEAMKAANAPKGSASVHHLPSFSFFFLSLSLSLSLSLFLPLPPPLPPSSSSFLLSFFLFFLSLSLSPPPPPAWICGLFRVALPLAEKPVRGIQSIWASQSSVQGRIFYKLLRSPVGHRFLCAEWISGGRQRHARVRFRPLVLAKLSADAPDAPLCCASACLTAGEGFAIGSGCI